jgi:hypothetical protein
MEATRVNWTDELLDELSHRVDEGFGRMDADLRDMRTEMNARFDALQGALIHVAGGMFGAFGAALIGLIATRL